MPPLTVWVTFNYTVPSELAAHKNLLIFLFASTIQILPLEHPYLLISQNMLPHQQMLVLAISVNNYRAHLHYTFTM